MRKYILTVLILTTWATFSTGQNLVPNPSFEIFSSCPTGAGEITKATGWYSPTPATPDYFNSCNTIGMGVPTNSGGFQNANSGVAYAGIGTYVQSNPNFRDYIQASLISTLVPENKYYVSFYVSPLDKYLYSTNTIGLLLTNTAISSASPQILPYVPQVENSISNNLIDTSLWYLIADTIVAIGGEKYITIGNFETSPNSAIDSTNYSATYGAAYYLIDDISIIDVTVGINEIDGEQNNFNLYPNPTNQFATLKFSNPTKQNCTLTLYDLRGQIVQTIKNITADKVEIERQSLVSGLYFFQLRTDRQIIVTGKLTFE